MMKNLPVWLANLLAVIVRCFIAKCNKERILAIRTKEDKELKLLCVWFPQTREEEHGLDDVAVSLRKKVNKVLIGYGQTAGNPMFYYYPPAKKVSNKVKIDKLVKYKIPLSLCDYWF